MESTLHRQLKEIYCGSSGEQEVRVGRYWIDAVVKGRLIEIQRASLSSIRTKIASLLETHRVTIVKPVTARTFIERRDVPDGPIVSSRFSPLRRTILNVFEELVHFGEVFPHPRLTLEIILVEILEERVVKSRRRFNKPDYKVADRKLRSVISTSTFRTARDLASLLPETLPAEFDTTELADQAHIPRWLAQKMVYSLRKAGALNVSGKRKNSILYSLCRRSARGKSRKVA